MKFENRCITDLQPYKLASHKIWEGIDISKVLKLDWNEATIPPSPLVEKRLATLLNGSIFQYYPDVNNQKLIQLLAEYCAVAPDNVQYFGSSDYAQEYIVKTFLTSGDKVLILSPTYENFRVTCASVGADVHTFYYQGNDYAFDSSGFSERLNELSPKIAYICNPNNPTGTVIELEVIKDLIEAHPETLFLVDEAYYEFSGVSCARLSTEYENLLVTRTFSKAFALANFRIGYIISNSTNIASLNKVRNAKNVSSFSQEAAICALSDVSYMKKYVDEVNIAKTDFAEKLSVIFPNISIVVGHGNFILLKFHDELDKDYFVGVLARNDIYTRDLSHVLGLENCVRITIGLSCQMTRVVEVIATSYK